MKFSTIFKVLLIIVMIGTALNTAEAQKKVKKENLPNEVFGLGISVGSMGDFGGNVVYAIKKDIHLGAFIGFYIESGTDDFDSKTSLNFAPYIKYFFMDPIRKFRPFIMGSFLVSSISTDIPTPQGWYRHTATNTGIGINVGAEWFPYSSIGILGGFRVVEAQFDPFIVFAGIGSSFIGIEWFL